MHARLLVVALAAVLVGLLLWIASSAPQVKSRDIAHDFYPVGVTIQLYDRYGRPVQPTVPMCLSYTIPNLYETAEQTFTCSITYNEEEVRELRRMVLEGYQKEVKFNGVTANGEGAWSHTPLGLSSPLILYRGMNFRLKRYVDDVHPKIWPVNMIPVELDPTKSLPRVFEFSITINYEGPVQRPVYKQHPTPDRYVFRRRG